jgi:hypothetical protein
MCHWLVEIESKLIQAIEEGCRPFGFSNHEFRLNEPVCVDFLESIEAMNGVRLPADYREFIVELGDGGAGPNHGLYRFCDGLSKGRLEKHWPEILGIPFPHESEFYPIFDPAYQTYYDPYHKGPLKISAEDSRWYYYHVDLVAGTIALNDYVRLVVNGPAKGSVWTACLDDDDDGGGLAKFAPDFKTWYTEWIESVLASGCSPDEE